MKKRMFCAILLFVFAAAFLWAMPAAAEKLQVEWEGTAYVVDTEQQTLSDGKNTYQYQLDLKNDGYDLVITYPNKATWNWTETNDGGFGGWSDDYDYTGIAYPTGETFQNILAKAGVTLSYKPQTGKNLLLFLVLLVIGGFALAAPQVTWYLEYGWRFKDAEPSDLALWVNRVIGFIVIVFAVVWFFFL